MAKCPSCSLLLKVIYDLVGSESFSQLFDEYISEGDQSQPDLFHLHLLNSILKENSFLWVLKF